MNIDRALLLAAVLLGALCVFAVMWMAVGGIGKRRPSPRLSLPPVPMRSRTNQMPVANADGNTPRLFPALPDGHMLVACPRVDGEPLRNWLIHHAGKDVWTNAVIEFYRRAATVPEIASYFETSDMDRLAG